MHASIAAGMRLARDSHQPTTLPSLISFEPDSQAAVPKRLSAFG
jgi:hypothetical protein